MRKVNLFGLEFWSAAHVDVIAQDVISRKDYPSGKLPLMVTPNVDQIVKLERKNNAALKKALSDAYWILPDGQPIVALSKLKYGSKQGLEARLTGSDFFPSIWKLLKKESDEKVLFIIPTEELGLSFVKERENTEFFAPPFFDLSNEQEKAEVLKAIVEKVVSFKPSYIFLGLGFPKQENIVLEIYAKAYSKGDDYPKTFLLGASYEFYFGEKKRAPKIWQKLGLEFVHRLFSEPRRMFKRYIIDDSAFLRLAIMELRRKSS
jgi:N-acetylglucosaminyldiphosphoundecaprenol N-acetyl-beta-D-mannosaminyltransferase